MGEQIDREVAWPVIGLAVAALLGVVIGIAAIPSATLVIVAMSGVQLGVGALGFLASRRPVLWAVAVALVILGSTVTDSRLAELAYSGAVPWIALAIAVSALNLYRHGTDWLAITSGTAALALGSVGVVAVSVRAGTPPTPAVLAATVPYLIGVLLALTLHLRDAREDRVRRPELSVGITDGQETSSAATGTLDAARRALAIVALRSDELVASTGDVSVRRGAADLRDVARRALTGESTTQNSIARIELHTAAIPQRTDTQRLKQTASRLPELPDREREILRLVATGASNAAIGRALYLSEATVKQYVSKLMRRFERDNRTQLALMAARWFDEPSQT
ncbi:response regulator transcription factor [Streptomyces bathyalis]|uniref:Response regulator transcription factor n=1 Tax=Streptomyces bathyalis TaxID=2710756 RepID=A0A7T1WTD0_9ACTN|nr:LuxR C-terminal-related transcriptional regulator [Streptomyces bathyalis]QPP08067.1 response regulator transcription factor [Streptomyces bathyalis]